MSFWHSHIWRKTLHLRKQQTYTPNIPFTFTDKMFNLLRKPQITSILLNGQKILNQPSAAKFCTTEAPKRIEKTINTVQLLGRVGANPQLRGNENTPVVTFSMATHTNYKCDNGDWAQRTDWHQVVVFRPDLRENVKNYLTKGQRILLNGKISYGEIRDKEGNTRNTTSIIAEDITFFY